MTRSKPRLLFTMGDVAGIGPELLARAWPKLVSICEPIVVGDADWLRRAVHLVGSDASVQELGQPGGARSSKNCIQCLRATEVDLKTVPVGEVDASAGRAAYDFLCRAIDLALDGVADGVVTCPINKEGLRAAGLPYPGHTEILAERTRAARYAMLLHGRGITVAHVTLHVALQDVFRELSQVTVVEKIELLYRFLPALGIKDPRIGVAALNPHASDGGIFGNEEQTFIGPAVESAHAEGINVTGPWPADALFLRAADGAFDGIVAMYHDQGHIPMKLLAGRRAVNVTAGLPIIRTSVAHGTAYDIAGRGIAGATSLVEAARVAAVLAAARRATPSMQEAR